VAENQKTVLYSSCRLLLRPIVLLLLKCGMTWKEFSDLSKLVFVEVATEEFGIRGRPTNVSRVSILTGISRKEITRQRGRLATATSKPSAKTNDASRLLSGWFQDPHFCDRNGSPLPLPERGAAPSFETLFQRYGGDTPFQTLLKELKAADSIAIDGAGRLTASRRYHMPSALSEENIRLIGTNLFDHARTLERNVAGRNGQERFEGYAIDDRIRASDAREFRIFVDERSQRFLEEIDSWLYRHRINDDDANTQPVRLGAGVYAVEGHLPEGPRS
jgi:hypothetical protein